MYCDVNESCGGKYRCRPFEWRAVLQVPASVRVVAGAATAQFAATASASGTGSVNVTATATNVSKTLEVMVTGAAQAISRVDCPATTLIGGTSTSCTVVLSGAAPAGGAIISLTSSVASVTVPATATIAAGSTSGLFTATAR